MISALQDPRVRIAASGGLLWVLGTVLAALAAVGEVGAVVALGLLAAYVGDVLLHAGDPRLPAWFGQHDLAAVNRALVREGTAVLAWVLIARPSAAPVVLVGLGVLTVHAAHLAYRWLTARHAANRTGRLAWLGVDVDGALSGPERLPPILPALGSVRGRRVLLTLDLPLVLGLLLSWSSGSTTWAIGGAIVTAVLVLGCVALALRRSALVRRLPTAAQENHRLLETLRELAPEVVVYFSGPVDTTYQLNVWLSTLERLSRPTLVVIREAHHLEALLPTSLPVVITPRAAQVEQIRTDSMLVALYPTTVIRNNHMIRLPGIRHVFINHGDGDKSVTYSPLHRVFDEIWVAGRAACERYLSKGEGVREDQLVVVGRPQLAHISPRRPRPRGHVPTVLYAPTWEGNFDTVDYSSVATMGEGIVRALLAAEPPLRVLVKPHPATGRRLPAAAGGRSVIEHLAQASPRAELVADGPEGLYQAFEECDVLVCDVSSVVADFLASRKPYIMTNPKDVDVEELHREFPSTAGGAVVGSTLDGLVDAVRDAVGSDSRRTRREELATYFLGEPDVDPVRRFVEEVDAACGRAKARHDRAEAVDAGHRDGAQGR